MRRRIQIEDELVEDIADLDLDGVAAESQVRCLLPDFPSRWRADSYVLRASVVVRPLSEYPLEDVALFPRDRSPMPSYFAKGCSK